MSIIRDRELSLSELIEESNLVVEVGFIKKYTEEVAVTRMDSFETFPPFIKKGNIFKVKGVLKNTAKITVPEEIKVPEENWRRSLSQHKEAVMNGPSKSYTVPEYKTEVKSISKAGILFLHHFQDMFDLTAKNAFEDLNSKEKITMIIQDENPFDKGVR
ncbi:MAG: hypothetical protein HOP08_17840 [Cyclobacteriaceae bacterium]|nr:hypothetical protein [Cyclobacteriaceae bacterium]